MKPLKSNVSRGLRFEGFREASEEELSSARRELFNLLLHNIADVVDNNLWEVFYDRD